MEINRAREALREKRLTYEAVGDLIGITPQAVAAIVNGQTTGATARFALASALGLTVSDLWPDNVDGLAKAS